MRVRDRMGQDVVPYLLTIRTQADNLCEVLLADGAGAVAGGLTIRTQVDNVCESRSRDGDMHRFGPDNSYAGG